MLLKPNLLEVHAAAAKRTLCLIAIRPFDESRPAVVFRLTNGSVKDVILKLYVVRPRLGDLTFEK